MVQKLGLKNLKHTQILDYAEIDFWRSSARILRRDKIKNTTTREKIRVKESHVETVKTTQLRGFGYVKRMQDAGKKFRNGNQQEKGKEDQKLLGWKREQKWEKHDQKMEFEKTVKSGERPQGLTDGCRKMFEIFKIWRTGR